MPGLNIFEDDAFSLSSLTAAINDVENVPGRLGQLGYFDEEGITTTTVQIEKDGEVLALVGSAERGAPGQVVVGDKRKLIPFNTVHLPERAYIKADEIQGIRAFGSETELQAVQTVVNKRLLKMRRQLDATHEWHRIGAVKGLVLDKDASSVLVDIFTAFGLTQQSVNFALNVADTKLRTKCLEVHEKIEDVLQGVQFSGVRVLCGRDFWASLITHKAIEETYLGTQMAAALRGDPRDAFDFGGCTFERYRGKVGGVAYVGDNEAYAVPEGVPELFITRFAPADYMETVNTNGLPFYAKQEETRMGKGIELEAQSNPLHLCTRPRAIIKLTRSA